MFKRTGGPSKIDEVISLDPIHMTEVFCPKCTTYCGFRSGSLRKTSGKSLDIVVGQVMFFCAKCEESFSHV